MGKLIRNAKKDKIPVMAVVGAKEVETNSLSIRTRASGELGVIIVDEVADKITEAITNFTRISHKRKKSFIKSKTKEVYLIHK